MSNFIVVLITMVCLLCINLTNGYRFACMRKTTSFLRSVSSLSSNKAPQVTKEAPPISIVENFFKEILSSKSQPTSVTSTLSKLHLLGSSLLSETPYPKLKDEAWRFTNVNGLFAPLPISNHWKLPSVSLADIEPYLDSNSYHVVFIDGVFLEHLSSKDIMYRGSKQLDVSVSVFKDSDALPVSDEEQLCHVPQHKVLPRESYGSDILTMINMVIYYTLKQYAATTLILLLCFRRERIM